LKIFVCEFITSGGLYREALADGLLGEGLLMRDALLSELAELEGIDVICAYDHRLPTPTVKHAVSVNEQDDVWQVWRDLISQSDAVWLIAPESTGILLQLTEIVTAQDKLLIGCPSSAVKLTSNKLHTYYALLHAGIDVVPTYTAGQWLAGDRQDEPASGWVIKPVDGVGCEDTVIRGKASDVAAWLEQGRQLSHIVQPRRSGEAASLSMLCLDGQAWLLSCNRQKVAIESSHFAYKGSMVNGFSEHWDVFDRLAQKIARSLPDLAGYVGVDLMVVNDNRLRLEVLEINPRLTTSYVGLRAATGTNVAGLILHLLGQKSLGMDLYRWPEISKNIIEVTLQ
jgi:predicted ATP-grasp superfamily ATP-dependent carboligase